MAGRPNIIVGKNPVWKVPPGLINTSFVAGSKNVAGAFAKMFISPDCPANSPPTPENQSGMFIT